jgi:hypothetical protein
LQISVGFQDKLDLIRVVLPEGRPDHIVVSWRNFDLGWTFNLPHNWMELTVFNTGNWAKHRYQIHCCLILFYRLV